MKTIYTAVLNRLNERVPAIRWIDLDFGQLETKSSDRPPVAYPCALITIEMPRCNDVTETIQDCIALVTVRLAFDPLAAGRTAGNAPEEVRETALNPYDVISDVYSALQGYETDNFNAFSRQSQGKEKRAGLFVYKMVFSTEFEDQTADAD